MINYSRVLKKVRCKSCSHECYDIYMENPHILYSLDSYVFDEDSGYMVCNVSYMFCPQCAVEDNYEYID